MLFYFQEITGLIASILSLPSWTPESQTPSSSPLAGVQSPRPHGVRPTPKPSRFSPYYSMDMRYLMKRDECSDVFGSNRTNAVCAPNRTLCCIVYGDQFPSCQQKLGKGWCCVGDKNDDTCFVDVPSDCNTPDAVQCSDSASGVKKACCPAGTTCEDKQPVQGVMRCHMNYSDLMGAAKSSSLSAVPSTIINPPKTATMTMTEATLLFSTTLAPAEDSSSITITSSPSTTSATSAFPRTITETSSSTNTAQPSPAPLPIETLAGIIIGVVLAVCILALAGWLLLRRRRRQRNSLKLTDPPPYSKQGPVEMAADNPKRPPVEMEAKRSPVEMEVDNSKRAPVEMDTNSPVCIFELDGTSIPFRRS